MLFGAGTPFGRVKEVSVVDAHPGQGLIAQRGRPVQTLCIALPAQTEGVGRE